MDAHVLSAFVATCFLVSLTPGLCSILCMSLATSIGVRRTQFMMLGEIAGMGTVAVAAVLSIAAILHAQSAVFQALKVAGCGYLVFLGWRSWQSAPEASSPGFRIPQTRISLAGLGFATAITNPKVWALYVALLPPFVDPGRPLVQQLTTMLLLIVVVELFALYLYAVGGRILARLLDHASSRVHIGRVLGVLMAAMGVWVLFQ